MPQLPQGFAGSPPPPSGTRLIATNGDETAFTVNQETDVRTALTRGLAEYLTQLSYEDPGGRQFQFVRVFDTWAEPEDESVYPYATVSAVGTGTYEASRFTGDVVSSQRVSPPDLPDSIYVVSPSEYTIDLEIDVRANDPEARAALCAMLERDLNPVDWRYGFILLLPHYFNQRGTFEMVSSAYVDDAEEAHQRLRRALFTVKGSVPMTLLRKYPNAKVRASVITT